METKEEIIKSLPHRPGVYIYRDLSGVILYVGKAKDLKKRVSQYFQRDDAVGAKTLALVSQIYTIETKITHSEFDALLLEAKLIHEYQPKYNVIAKDDKSPLYVSISFDEDLPRIQLIRRPAVEKVPKRAYFGPFQSGGVIRKLLRELRRVIPYCTQKERNGRACFYTHLGQCDPCPSVVSVMPDGEARRELTHRYRRNLFRIKDILAGKSLQVIYDLEAEMGNLAKKEQFEAASQYRTYIERLRQLLETHYDPTLYVQSDMFLENIYDEELISLKNHLRPYYTKLESVERVECVDISNTAGQNATASLVVFIHGRPDNTLYRRFRMRTKVVPNDFAMIHEVVERRLRHEEWSMPNLLVIDGGKGQVHAALAALADAHKSIPVIGLAKRFEEIIIPIGDTAVKTLRLHLNDKGLHLLQAIRDESHRFALTYHRKLRAKSWLPKDSLV